jgi:hypothetical protein
MGMSIDSLPERFARERQQNSSTAREVVLNEESGSLSSQFRVTARFFYGM